MIWALLLSIIYLFVYEYAEVRVVIGTFDSIVNSYLKGTCQVMAEEGSPLGQFSYGLYYLLFENDEKTAEEWWNKFFYHSNGYGLWKASGIFAYLGDEYYEWSMKCLRRSTWRQFKIAKMMLKDMKENPYKFPEA